MALLARTICEHNLSVQEGCVFVGCQEEEPEDGSPTQATGEEEPSDEDEDTQCYNCLTTVEEENFMIVEDQIEQAPRVQTRSSLRQLKSAVHVSMTSWSASILENMGRSLGVDIRKRIHSFRLKSGLTIEQQRQKVDTAKRNSTCRACGEHCQWAGDSVCKARGGKGSSKRGLSLKRTQFQMKEKVLSSPKHKGCVAGFTWAL